MYQPPDQDLFTICGPSPVITLKEPNPTQGTPGTVTLYFSNTAFSKGKWLAISKGHAHKFSEPLWEEFLKATEEEIGSLKKDGCINSAFRTKLIRKMEWTVPRDKLEEGNQYVEVTQNLGRHTLLNDYVPVICSQSYYGFEVLSHKFMRQTSRGSILLDNWLPLTRPTVSIMRQTGEWINCGEFYGSRKALLEEIPSSSQGHKEPVSFQVYIPRLARARAPSFGCISRSAAETLAAHYAHWMCRTIPQILNGHLYPHGHLEDPPEEDLEIDAGFIADDTSRKSAIFDIDHIDERPPAICLDDDAIDYWCPTNTVSRMLAFMLPDPATDETGLGGEFLASVTSSTVIKSPGNSVDGREVKVSICRI